MKFDILTYGQRDGSRTLRDSFIMDLYDRMVNDGSDKTVFYAGHIDSRESFLKYIKNPSLAFYVLTVDGEVVGMTWLDHIEDKKAYNHFCVFSEFWGKDTVKLGRATLGRLINMQYGGQYVFDLFTGIVPVWNTLAIDFAVACGGKNLGIVPCGIWNAKKQKSESAAFIYYTREGEDDNSTDAAISV